MGVVKVVLGGRLEISVHMRCHGGRKELVGNRRKNRSADSTPGKLPKKSPVDLIERHVVEASSRESDKVCECYELLQHLQFI
jgi:hypothetical protein